MIKLETLKRILAVIFFAAGYHAVYISYLHPTFEYLYYRLEDREWLQWLFIYVIAIIPAIWQRARNDAIVCVVSIIYMLLYVPALITMCAMWIMPFNDLVLVALTLMTGQFILQFATTKNEIRYSVKSKELDFATPRVQLLVAIFTVVSLIIFIDTNRSHMNLVRFSDVYDLRFASRDASSVLSGYLSMWLLGVSVPFYLAVAVLRKQWLPLAVAVFISLILYMGNGAKSALLMPIQAMIVGALVDKSRNPSQLLGLILGSTMWFLYALDFESLNTLKSLLIMRTLSTGGWMISIYYEYFSENGWTYFTHVGPIAKIFGKVYQLQLGQIIGFEFFSSEVANLNANFWATDGIAAFGIPGIIISSLLVALSLQAIKLVSHEYNQKAVAILLSGLCLSILNGSIFTSMLSGGGFILMALLMIGKSERH
ncbi:hypothetical protein [Limnohabitans sp. 2KL-51]|uniref:hypothetical protein n=1 Tax=Limnohabitans sp. 2KL-51 TaxID=1977911 RepID=UPI0011B22DDF|nr:hypothetical protein [Limnohabitans sp. 2KL-51]